VSYLPTEKKVEWVDVRKDDAALIPLNHMKQLRNFKGK
jgi:mannose-6-phosphate isomerase-like protein (cupin superfamily)